MNTRQKKISILLFIVILSLACAPLDFGRRILAGLAPTPTLTPPPTTPVDTTTDIWYVSLSGDDSNSCTTLEDACATLAVALAKSTPADQIIIAEGAYDLPGYRGLIWHHLTITGAGESLTILDGAGGVSGFRINGTSEVRIEDLTVQNTVLGSPYACIQASGSSRVILENVTVRECERTGLHIDSGAIMFAYNVTVDHVLDEDRNPDFILNGSGILNLGEMTLNNSLVINNEDAGIVNSGFMTINDTVIRGNATEGIVVSGGEVIMHDGTVTGNGVFNGQTRGIVLTGGVMEAFDSVFDANLGPAISVLEGAVLRLTDSEITNHADFALAVRSGGVAVLTRTDIENNARGADALFTVINEGNLSIYESNLNNNAHFGLYNIGNGVMLVYGTNISNQTERAVYNQDATGEVWLVRVLVTSSGEGLYNGVVFNGGTMRLINSTISNNTGIGLRSRGNATLSYVTIAENSGLGLQLESTGPYEVNNSIIARNSGGNCDIFLDLIPVTLGGVNIDTDGSCGVTTYTTAELALDVLADNGGVTFTHALLDGSPAIDVASGPCPSTDQRWLGFGRPFGPSCDVGAFEASAVAMSMTFEEIVIVETDTACYTGPGSQWALVNYMKAGAQLSIIGIGFDNNWMVTTHPDVAFTQCWIDMDDISFDIPLDLLRIIAIPPKPAPPPTITPEPRPKEPGQPDPPTPCGPNDPGYPNC